MGVNLSWAVDNLSGNRRQVLNAPLTPHMQLHSNRVVQISSLSDARYLGNGENNTKAV
jgi:hypothetical protein